MGGDIDILDVTLGINYQFVKLFLGLGDTFNVVSSDVYLILTTPMGSWRSVAVDSRKWWREVDGSVGSGLNQTNVLSCPSADDTMQGQLQLHYIHQAFQLQF